MTYNLDEFKEWIIQRSYLADLSIGYYAYLTDLLNYVKDFSELLNQEWLVNQIAKLQSENSTPQQIQDNGQKAAEQVSQIVNFFIQEQELKQLKAQKNELESKLKAHDQTITEFSQKFEQLGQVHQQLVNQNEELKDQLEQKEKGLRDLATINSRIKRVLTIRDLQAQIDAKEHKLREETSTLTTSLRKEIEELKTQLATVQSEKDNKISNLENQLTALAVSSSLLTQQVEDLNTQLSEKEQENQRKQFELEIKANLLQEKDNNLSQQEQKLTDYQSLLRKNDENLAKLQKAINEKSNQLEQLTEQKDSLADLLAQSEEKTNEVENSLNSSQTRIQELENQIKELEENNPNSNELTRLKQELVNLKNNSQSEINSLKNQLTQAKLKEAQLSKKIQELTSQKSRVSETTANNSWWEQVKTPLYWLGGGLIILFVLSWIRSKLKG